VTISRFGRDQLKEIVSVQAAIRREFAPHAESITRAFNYAANLYGQFGLKTASKPTILDDPSLAAIVISDPESNRYE
jgi:hypothetical protein